MDFGEMIWIQGAAELCALSATSPYIGRALVEGAARGSADSDAAPVCWNRSVSKHNAIFCSKIGPLDHDLWASKVGVLGQIFSFSGEQTD